MDHGLILQHAETTARVRVLMREVQAINRAEDDLIAEEFVVKQMEHTRPMGT